MTINRYTCFTIITAFAGLVLVYTCKEKYMPATRDINPNYLVVEGLINTGNDSTIFTLSRTFKLETKAAVAPEKGAIVQVESDGGATYVLPELIKSGTYGHPPLNLDHTKKYRLRIRTKDSKEYLSDFVESKISPPVDKVTYDFKNGEFNIYASTHDGAGKSGYYKYQYVETWAYNAPLISYFKIENHQILRRLFPKDDIYHCWKSAPSSNIALGNSTNNTKDKLEDQLINTLAPNSFKILIGYSILLKQTVLTKQGFDYWQAMQKNNQTVGSIFDPQPSQLFSNIKSISDPAEVVIGFVSAGTVTEKRLTLSTHEMVPGWRQTPELDATELCNPFSNANAFKTFIFTSPLGQSEIDTYLLTPNNPVYIILDAYPPAMEQIGWTATKELKCADCRLQGGTTIKPSYWY